MTANRITRLYQKYLNTPDVATRVGIEENICDLLADQPGQRFQAGATTFIRFEALIGKKRFIYFKTETLERRSPHNALAGGFTFENRRVSGVYGPGSDIDPVLPFAAPEHPGAPRLRKPDIAA